MEENERKMKQKDGIGINGRRGKSVLYIGHEQMPN
jgi:hypothetical protein